MINTSTINKLIEMRMTAMADAVHTQLQDSSMQGFSFEEFLGICPGLAMAYSLFLGMLVALILNSDLDSYS